MMFFISKKKFEREVQKRIEKAFFEEEARRCRNEEIREIHNRICRMEMRLERVEDKCGIPSNLSTNAACSL